MSRNYKDKGVSFNESAQISGRKIALVSTVPFYLVFQLSGHIKYLLNQGAEVTLITSPGDELKLLDLSNENLKIVKINIPRKIHIFKDLIALIQLFVFFKKKSFEIMHTGTPKAGFLCAIAGKISGIPVRLHTFTGQAWLTRKFVMRSIMIFSDKLILKLSSHCYADSHSQREFLIKENIAKPNNISVNGEGSLSGVDLNRFSIERFKEVEKDKIRKELNINKNSFVIIYIGRITKEKGLHELLSCFEKLNENYSNVKLVLLGPIDDASGSNIIKRANQYQNIIYLGWKQQPEKYLSISNILCLPSYREGFGTVIIEAAAMGVPSIGTNIVGLKDAIVNGNTGVLVEPKSSHSLYLAFKEVINKPQLLNKLGENARLRCYKSFDEEKINEIIMLEYLKHLNKAS